MVRFELGASVVVWRGSGREILVMKRSPGGRGSGGWFIPGGHCEPAERPVETAARELFEEAGIAVSPANLRYAEIMTWCEAGGLTAHLVIYSVEVPEATAPVINEEHLRWAWIEPPCVRGGAARCQSAPGRGQQRRDGCAVRGDRPRGGRGRPGDGALTRRPA